MNHGEPNCIGYAYHRLEIDQEEQGRDLPSIRGFLEKFRPVGSVGAADGIAVYNKCIDAITHMAVLDPDARDYVFERQGVGQSPRRVSVQQAIGDYVHFSPSQREILFRKKIG